MSQNSNGIPPTPIRFRITMVGLIGFSHELVARCFSMGKTQINPMLISFAESFLNNIDPELLITNFVKYSYSHWNMIKEKNERFFIEHSSDIFKDLNNPMIVNLFKDLFLSRDNNGNMIINAEERENIWSHFQALVKISIHHIHENRIPSWKDTNGVNTKIYTKSYLTYIPRDKNPDGTEKSDLPKIPIKLQVEAVNWGVTLKWP